MQEEVKLPVQFYKATEEFRFTIIAEPHEHYCEFKCYEAYGDFDEPNGIYYDITDSASTPNPTDDLDKAQVYLSGTVKWDGCSNLDFDINEGCAIHFCGRKDISKVGKLLERLYDLAAQLIPRWDAICAA